MSGTIISSIGKKLMMSLAAIFLLLFLPVHLGINLLLVFFEDPMVYNKAAHFMSSNILVKIFEVFLMATLLVHVIWALILQIQNWMARPKKYRKENFANTSFFSKYMIHTAIITLTFLAIHFVDFYFKAKTGNAHEVMYHEMMYHDFAWEIKAKFSEIGYTIFYVAAFIFLGFHLVHGFQSAFKTLGIENEKYNLTIQILSLLYTFIIVAGFTFIPIYIHYLT